MQKVYESSTAPEAHSVRILLESKGIQSQIDGEHLPSGAGILPATRLVRVMVEEVDFIAASEVIDDWESEHVPESKAREDKPSYRSFKWFVVGALLASGAMYWHYNSPVTVDGIDYNADGKLDEKWIYNNNRISKTSFDRNLDGNEDQIYYFGSAGIIKSGELDYDFDGSFEARQQFFKGNIISEEIDRNQDEFFEYRTTFKFGVIQTVEIYDEKTKKLRKRQFFENNRLVGAEYDSTGDGVMDVTYNYDAFEEIRN